MSSSCEEAMNGERTLKEQWLEEKQEKLKELYPQMGQFFEINGFLFRVRKIGTKGDVVLRRFTGTIEVPERIQGWIAEKRPLIASGTVIRR